MCTCIDTRGSPSGIKEESLQQNTDAVEDTILKAFAQVDKASAQACLAAGPCHKAVYKSEEHTTNTVELLVRSDSPNGNVEPNFAAQTRNGEIEDISFAHVHEQNGNPEAVEDDVPIKNIFCMINVSLTRIYSCSLQYPPPSNYRQKG